MGLRLAEAGGRSGLKARVLSALALGPLTLFIAYLGNPYIGIELTIMAVIMAWEWSRVCNNGRFGPDGWVSVAVVLIALTLALFHRYDHAVYAIAIGMAVVAVVALSSRHRASHYAAIAPLAIGLSCVAMVWVRDAAVVGLSIFLWLLMVVWWTDVGAYFVGRRLGGPKLAPRISPKKTWSGLVGGAACAALWGLLWGALPVVWGETASYPWLLGLLGACMAVLAQLGDISMSVVKRRFGAKDASSLIPGHGGVLDRFDGFIISAPALAIFVWITKGNAWPPL